MFDVTSHVVSGGLASYNVSFYEMGRLSAKYVQRLLAGIEAKDMPVEAVNKIDLAINLKLPSRLASRFRRICLRERIG